MTTSPSDEMTCRELVELVTEYLEQALPTTERQRFDEHLSACRGCRRHLDQMNRTIRLVGRLAEEDVTPAAKSALLAAFRNWKQTGGAQAN